MEKNGTFSLFDTSVNGNVTTFAYIMTFHCTSVLKVWYDHLERRVILIITEYKRQPADELMTVILTRTYPDKSPDGAWETLYCYIVWRKIIYSPYSLFTIFYLLFVHTEYILDQLTLQVLWDLNIDREEIFDHGHFAYTVAALLFIVGWMWVNSNLLF